MQRLMRNLLPVFVFLLCHPRAEGSDNPGQDAHGFLLPPVQVPAETFQAHGGTWRVMDGVLHAGGGPGPKLLARESNMDAGEAGVEMMLPGRRGGNAGLIVKVGRAGVGADRFDGYEVALDSERQMLRLGRHRQNFELIQDAPCPVPVDQWIALKVAMTRNTIAITVNGKAVIHYEDRSHPLARGVIGLRTWQRPARFRNLWMRRDGRVRRWTLASPPSERSEGLRQKMALHRLPPMAVVVRHPLSRPPAVGQDLWSARPRRFGCAIRLVTPGKPAQPAATLFEDPDGCIYDMNVSRDARTLFFSYRKKDDPHWHIWRIGADGKGLTQLTRGPFYDVSPCELPSGDIVFVSTRRFGYTLCQPGPSSNLHVMHGDGSDIRCVSMNTLSDLSPQLLPDGRVLFTRWEYIDRDLTFRQSLWTQNPDGRGYQLFFGNTIRDVGTFWQARPLPGGGDRVVATFAPHHGWPHGAIGLIDPNYGVEGAKETGFTYITREFPVIHDTSHEWSYRDPFPLSDSLFLCAYGADVRRYRIVLLDRHNNKRLVYEEPEMSCYFPLPLTPARAGGTAPGMAQAPVTGSGKTVPMGTFLLVDVYRGLGPAIQRGRVKRLRIMEQLRKTEDLVARAYDQSPVMSYGTYYAKRSWGTVPVMPDGSAYFKAPALREIYFQALDAEGRELQRMTSAVQLMPGEQRSCIGCHEGRQTAVPVGRQPMAVREGPKDLTPPPWGHAGLMDFNRLVQPVLDRHCVSCHNAKKPLGGYVLTGDKTRYFSMAYDHLLGRSRSYRQHDMARGNMLPSEKARGKPLVHFYWLLKTPTAVNRPLWSGSFASRLTGIIESDHAGKPLPLADRRRIYAWMDANVPYYDTYAHGRSRSPGRRDRWTDADTGRLADWFARDFMDVYRRRCADCHGNYGNSTTDWEGRFAWLNLSRPRESPALLVHLAKQAGGWGVPVTKAGRPSMMFHGTEDRDYRKMHEAIAAGGRAARQHPEPDMAGLAPSSTP